MKTQREIFLQGEADCWVARNRRTLSAYRVEDDPVARHLRPFLCSGQFLAEVGCATGGRIAALAGLAGGRAAGIDPSQAAVAEARLLHPDADFQAGTADDLPWENASVDVLIYGFCLYLCDRSELFRIAAEGDRVLRDGGLVAVLDFCPPFPYRNAYSHREGVFSYKLQHAALWSWNPHYIEISRQIHDHSRPRDPGAHGVSPDERIGVVVLKKQTAHAYPLRQHYGD